ncbi:hypothetical protein HNY73_020491 [Argiope bruennichi]|uniref:Uncharacterized protein n=1 Tax=Argiope bruennichi TaxID=94029 RepID=A0A8T0EAS9_ARGBR|nr:hypothetical protein HNY73_020491 [Argiope bruennichi]
MASKLPKTWSKPLIRVAVNPLPGHMEIIKKEDGQISVSGMEGMLMDAVLTALGYRYELVIPADGEW